MRTRSSCRADSNVEPCMLCTWTAKAKPSNPHSAPMSIPARTRGRHRTVGQGSFTRGNFIYGVSRPEQVPADRRHIAEDPDAEHHDDTGGQLPADTELITEEHDHGRDQDVRDE